MLIICFPIILGTPALTSRQFKEQDFGRVVDMIETGVKIALAAQNKSGKIKILFNSAFPDRNIAE